ncbi:AlpA family phage regulatory protein [Psychrobacter sp. S1-30-MNA-CIBAN-0213]|uniref:helix-turn-helix transcriptional regulator n=1 Tax=Psychrobacter sp. S1-30-MNA-CIBAN-0213 TaxID=3140456 RepID=UPI00332CA457
MTQSSNQTSVIPFSDNTSNKATTATNPAMQLPTTGMGRAKDILPFLPFSKTTLWEWSKDGRFPAPIKLSPTLTAWMYADVHKWLNSHTSNSSGV